MMELWICVKGPEEGVARQGEEVGARDVRAKAVLKMKCNHSILYHSISVECFILFKQRNGDSLMGV